MFCVYWRKKYSAMAIKYVNFCAHNLRCSHRKFEFPPARTNRNASDLPAKRRPSRSEAVFSWRGVQSMRDLKPTYMCRASASFSICGAFLCRAPGNCLVHFLLYPDQMSRIGRLLSYLIFFFIHTTLLYRVILLPTNPTLTKLLYLLFPPSSG